MPYPRRARRATNYAQEETNTLPSRIMHVENMPSFATLPLQPFAFATLATSTPRQPIRTIDSSIPAPYTWI